MLKEKENNIAILLMGGEGRRFSPSLPKQFFLIKGKPLFFYASKTLNDSKDIDFIIYVAPKNFISETEKYISELGLKKEHAVISGGQSREESTFEAIKYLETIKINEKTTILIQDGDRPFLNERLIEENINECKKSGAALTMIPSSDSLALVFENKVKRYLPRKDVYLLQTPQTFTFYLIKSAFLCAKFPLKDYTDEGSLLLEESIVEPSIVLGSKENVKITEKSDLLAFGE